MNKIFRYILLLLLICTTSVKSQDIVISNIANRHTESLNGKWKYIIDLYETGQLGFMPIYADIKPKDKTDRVEYSFDKAQTLWVPGAWNYQKPELYYYEGSVWYRKTFDKQNLSKEKRYFIHFGAANYLTTVTFNGKVLGRHEGGFTPFCYEITSLLKEKDNYLVVGVSNTRSENQVPAKVTDWFNHGGITRDVNLVEVPKTFISHYFVRLDKSSLMSKAKIIQGTVNLNNATAGQKVRMIISQLGVSKEVLVNDSGRTEFSVPVKNLELWSPENPKLYDVVIATESDTVRDKIGFRTIETKGNQILLNGAPVFLRGISLHDENPIRRDRANSMDDARLVLGWAKELGCNFLRLAHYPHQENIVRLADEMGIMLWEELPLYWGIDWGNPKVLQKAKDQFSALINRDANRASSIIWSIANETSPSPVRNQFLISLAEYLRKMDNTRLLSAACKKDQAVDGHPDNDYTLGDPIMKYLDIISFNEYLGWYGGLPEECRKKTYKAQMDKPIIVSEFGGGALQGFYGDSLTRWTENFQANLYKENLSMFDRIEGLAGMTPWILVDFMSPLRQLPDVQDGWNRKGVVSEKGVKKKAFFVLQNYYTHKKSVNKK